MSFFKTFLAVILGLFTTAFLLTMILIGIVASSSTETEPYIRTGTVLNIPVFGVVSERAAADPFAEIFDSGASDRVTMDRFRSVMRKAKADERIAGIRLDLSYAGGSFTHLTEMRDLLIDFKSTGKFIYAYIDDRGANEAGYFIATAADSIFAQPETYLELDGFYIQSPFFSNTLERYGLEMEVINTGSYKTAAATFIEDEFSASDREQLQAIMQGYTDVFVQAASEFTGHETSRVNEILNSQPNILIQHALDNGFVHGLMFESEFEDFLSERTDNSSLRDVDFGRYNRVSNAKAGVETPGRNAKEIAVVFAEGPIMPDVGGSIFDEGGTIHFNKMRETIDDLVEDDNVAAIVVRVNSPGGAVTTSEAIKNLLEQASQVKPLMVSMGPVAASGGYYIAMGADSVFAEANTITGSIGVILTKLSYGKALEENFGVTHDEIRSHTNADWFSPVNTLTAEQRNGLQNIADITYQNFLELVAEARGTTADAIHPIAQGRVWTGQTALELGLVDGIGALPDVIVVAAERAGVEEFTVGHYPAPENFLESLMASGNAQIHAVTRHIFGVQPAMNTLLRDIHRMNRPQVFSILDTDFSVN